MERAIQLLQSKVGSSPSLQPDAITLTTLVDGYTRKGEAEKALRLFDASPRLRIRRDTVSFQAAINACSKLGQWERALALLREMEAEGLPNSRKAVCSAMSSCTNGGRPERALELFEWSVERGEADGVLYSNAITAHGEQ